MIVALERDLPPATLLLGPDLEQMVSEAIAAAKRQGSTLVDRFTRRHVSAEDARRIVRFAQTAPFGPFKLVIACLDGSTPVAQNILLKVLEEPPDTIRFILVASERPLPTIVSRCQVVMVQSAGSAGEPDPEVLAKVDAVLRAAAAADLRGLDRELAGWGESHQAALMSRLTEVAAAHGMDGPVSRPQARRLLGALGRFAGASPRLAAHAALVSVLSDRESHA